MVWKSFAAFGIGELEFIETTMNAQGYVQILDENTPLSVAKLVIPGHWLFQQDWSEWAQAHIPLGEEITECPNTNQIPSSNTITIS